MMSEARVLGCILGLIFTAMLVFGFATDAMPLFR